MSLELSAQSVKSGYRPSPTIVKRLVVSMKRRAGDVEVRTYRDAFLAYGSETTALGIGLALTWLVLVQGRIGLLGLVYGAAVYGRAHAENGQRRKVFVECVENPGYFLAGVVAAGVLITALVAVNVLVLGRPSGIGLPL